MWLKTNWKVFWFISASKNMWVFPNFLSFSIYLFIFEFYQLLCFYCFNLILLPNLYDFPYFYFFFKFLNHLGGIQWILFGVLLEWYLRYLQRFSCISKCALSKSALVIPKLVPMKFKTKLLIESYFVFIVLSYIVEKDKYDKFRWCQLHLNQNGNTV